MDNSREADLVALHERFNNPNLSKYARQKAHKSFLKIQSKLNDRKLNRMRHRLIKAHIAEDAEEASKIEHQIREHSWHKYGDTPSHR